MIKVLAIGNSFSQDAMHYLHQLAEFNGIDIKCQNLCIGGCSLETHYNNIKGDLTSYRCELNSKFQKMISIKEALLSDDWNYITLQQASHLSINYDTYRPYISEIANYIREIKPDAKILIHKTWMYEADSQMLASVNIKTPEEMYNLLSGAYSCALNEIKPYGLIPSGDAMFMASQQGFKVHRDGFHASLGFGRLLIASVWLKALTSITTNKGFNDFDEAVSDNEYDTIINIVNKLFS